jgi:hypothetical protein
MSKICLVASKLPALLRVLALSFVSIQAIH